MKKVNGLSRTISQILGLLAAPSLIVVFSLLVFIAQKFALTAGIGMLATFGVIVISILGITISVLVGRIVGGIRGRIAAILIGYLSIVFLFSVVYYSLFLRSPFNFAFAARGDEGKAIQDSSRSYNLLKECNRRLLALAALQTDQLAISKAATRSRPNGQEIPVGANYRLYSGINISMGGTLHSFTCVIATALASSSPRQASLILPTTL